MFSLLFVFFLKKKKKYMYNIYVNLQKHVFPLLTFFQNSWHFLLIVFFAWLHPDYIRMTWMEAVNADIRRSDHLIDMYPGHSKVKYRINVFAWQTNSNVMFRSLIMYGIYGKAPLNNCANKWGAWWVCGNRCYQWPVNLLYSQSRAPSLLRPPDFSPG